MTSTKAKSLRFLIHKESVNISKVLTNKLVQKENLSNFKMPGKTKLLHFITKIHSSTKIEIVSKGLLQSSHDDQSFTAN